MEEKEEMVNEGGDERQRRINRETVKERQTRRGESRRKRRRKRRDIQTVERQVRDRRRKGEIFWR